MAVAYRIAKTKFSGTHDEMFSGIGAAMHGGRWNTRGHHMVYASDSRALATLEIAVHLNNTAVLGAYSVCEITIPDGLWEEVTPQDLPNGWNEQVINPLVAQSWGDLWLSVGATPAVKVPSVVIPSECNYLLNPNHVQFGDITWADIEPHPFDIRIIGDSSH